MAGDAIKSFNDSNLFHLVLGYYMQQAMTLWEDAWPESNAELIECFILYCLSHQKNTKTFV